MIDNIATLPFCILSEYSSMPSVSDIRRLQARKYTQDRLVPRPCARAFVACSTKIRAEGLQLIGASELLIAACRMRRYLKGEFYA